jgi:hypothetical protein
MVFRTCQGWLVFRHLALRRISGAEITIAILEAQHLWLTHVLSSSPSDGKVQQALPEATWPSELLHIHPQLPAGSLCTIFSASESGFI